MGHGLMCADVALAFRQAARAHVGHELVDWECDWAAAERLGSTVVVPDAHLAYRAEGSTLDAFLEVDLGTEGSRVFGRKVDRYLDLYRNGEWRAHLPVWPLVITVTVSPTRAALLRRATATVLDAQYDSDHIKQVTGFAFSTKPVPRMGRSRERGGSMDWPVRPFRRDERCVPFQLQDDMATRRRCALRPRRFAARCTATSSRR
jgi:hypothetical protein